MDLDAFIKLGTLVFAGVAALVSWLNFRKSGTQKVAQFRKEWIENLRVSLAEYYSLCFKAVLLEGLIKLAKEKTDTEREKDLRRQIDEAYNRVTYVISYVRLMLNKGEPLHDRISEIMQSDVETGFAANPSARNEFIQVGRELLKTEWEKAKAEM